MAASMFDFGGFGSQRSGVVDTFSDGNRGSTTDVHVRMVESRAKVRVTVMLLWSDSS